MIHTKNPNRSMKKVHSLLIEKLQELLKQVATLHCALHTITTEVHYHQPYLTVILLFYVLCLYNITSMRRVCPPQAIFSYFPFILVSYNSCALWILLALVAMKCQLTMLRISITLMI